MIQCYKTALNHRNFASNLNNIYYNFFKYLQI